MMATLLFLFAIVFAEVGFAAVGFAAILFGVLLSSRWLRERQIDVRARVSGGPEGLVLDGKLRAPAAMLRAGFVVPDGARGPFVLLERKRRWPLRIRVRSAREGRVLLRALGLDAAQKAVSCDALCGKLTIGVDGLACSGPGGESFFLSSGEIASVSTYSAPGADSPAPPTRIRGGGRDLPPLFRPQRGVDIELRDGRTVRIPVTELDGDPLLALVEERIRECAELSRGRRRAAADEQILARRGRDGREWVRGLRASVNAGYRDVAVDPEHLSRVLRDAWARPSARAASALVLASSGDASATGKLRIAAESIANPRVRVALEHIADASDDAAVAEALEALDEAEREERPR
jgi:hypothetical protein